MSKGTYNGERVFTRFKMAVWGLLPGYPHAPCTQNALAVSSIDQDGIFASCTKEESNKQIITKQIERVGKVQYSIE